MNHTDTATTVEERYTTAITTSNLRVEADKGGSADVIIAVGWSASRIGAALMRLHTEYDSAAIPPGQVSNTDRALLQCKLKSLPAVLEQVTLQAEKWGIDRPAKVALAVIAFWLDKHCVKCGGHRFERVPGTPALSARHCKACRGSGEMQIPYGSHGVRIERMLDEAVERAQASIKYRLRSMK